MTVLGFQGSSFIVPKIGEMGHFWTPDQQQVLALYICPLGFPDIISDDRQRLSKNDDLGF